jgi:DNA-binding GntR family transcriptional regulator
MTLPAPSTAAPPSAETQATAVFRRLRTDILEGRLAPGLRLKVQDLAMQYGVGAAPLREALSQLAAEGWARRIEQRGFRVANADAAGFAGLIRTRCLVEPLALRESVTRGDVRWEDGVAGAERRLARLPHSLEAHRFVANPAWKAAHLAFHHALIAACEAPPLLAFCERLHEEAERYRAVAGTLSYGTRDVAAEHAAIAAAALDRDAERAASLLRQHLSTTGEYVRRALDAARRRPPAAARRRAVHRVATTDTAAR